MLGNQISPADQRNFYRRLIATLEALDLTYAIGDSVAAKMYGKPRYTEASNSPPATEQSHIHARLR
jgi:hypothetical protein